MQKLLIGLAAAAATVSVAAPASAQAYGNMTPYAAPTYNYSPYAYGRGYNGMAFARTMVTRVQRVRADIRNMEARRILSRREANSLEMQARNLERRIYRAPRNGVQVNEARRIEMQIRNLEVRVSREATDRNNRPGHYRR